MNTKVSVSSALQAGAQKRTRKYRHKPGAFTLTASFRGDAVTMALVHLVGRLIDHFPQKEVARLLGTSTSTIGKMVRIHAYSKESQS